jgi:hypothetical protein
LVRRVVWFTDGLEAIALTMEIESTSETSVNFYQLARRNNTEDSHIRHHENLRSHLT